MKLRRGMGVALPLVVGLMGLLILIAAYRLFGSGAAMHQAARDAGGAVAENLAMSAIEEALWTFEQGVNDPENPLFEAVRHALLTGDRPELDLSSALAPRQLPALLEKSEHRAFYSRTTLEPLVASLRIPIRAAASARLAGRETEAVAPQGEQVLDLACAARLELGGHTIWRQVLVRRRYGITFVSPYKPFDAVTFAIVQSDFLESYPRVVAGVGATLDQLAGARELLDQLVTYMGVPPPFQVQMAPRLVTLGRPPAMPAGTQAALETALGELGPESPVAKEIRRGPWDEVGFAAWNLVAGREGARIDRTMPAAPLPQPPAPGPAGPAASGLARDLPDPASVIYSNAPRVQLEDFDYEVFVDTRVSPALEDLVPLAEAWNAAVADLVADPGSELTAAQVQALSAAAAKLASHAAGPLTAGTVELNRITEHLKRHTRMGFNRDVLQGYLATASKRLRSLAFHADTAAQIGELRAKLPAFNGHLGYYGTDPLTLDVARWRGMAVISAPWSAQPVPVSIPAFSLDDPGRDLAVLNFDEIHFSSGTVEAGVFVNQRAVFEGSPTIQGNLVLNRLASRATRSLNEDLLGTVVRDPRLASGGYWKRAADDGPWSGALPAEVSLGHYTVGLAPRGQQKAIYRSPEGAGLVRDEAGGDE